MEIRARLLQATTALILSLSLGLAGCGADHKELVVGCMKGPEAELVQAAKLIAEKDHGLKVRVVEYASYDEPNAALAKKEIDLNLFQHQSFLSRDMKEHNYDLTVIGKTFLYPMGLYSTKVQTLTQLPQQARIGVPNDPTNTDRAIKLLAKNDLITVPQTNELLTPAMVIKNPRNLQIVPLEAGQLPSMLSELDAACINTTFAAEAKLDLNTALAREAKDAPYVNLIVARTEDKEDSRFDVFIKSFQNPKVVEKAGELFHDFAIAGW